MGCTDSKEKKPEPKKQEHQPAQLTVPPPATAAETQAQQKPKEEPAETKKEDVTQKEETKKEEPKEEKPKQEEPKPEETKVAEQQEEKEGEQKSSGPDAMQKVNLLMFKAQLSNKITESAMTLFMQQYKQLQEGATGLISESDISSVADLPSHSSLPAPEDVSPLFEKVVLMKLNGGLGTGMGLSKAKSLLEVKKDTKFLDFIIRQVDLMKHTHSDQLSFMLMNSFSTQEDTKRFFNWAEPQVGNWSDIHIIQNKVLKIEQATLEPASHPDEELNWCPPGHGDLYAALYGNGKLQELVDAGKEIMFVSNSDNLGATLDPKILEWFAKSEKEFLMEVCERTEADKKGGHLAIKGDGLVLREAAQCAPEDEADFQNVGKHKYFNTNNLWIKLPALLKLMQENNGIVQLPLIRNSKTVDPRDKTSTKVYQLETAMGAAIESFGNKAAAVVVGRERFAPVKTCNDLLSVRSDAYEVTPEHTIRLAPSRNGVPPTVSLGDAYKMVPALEKLTQGYDAVPSLVACDSLKVTGEAPLTLEPGVVFKGTVVINTGEGKVKTLAAGEYSGEVNL